MDSKYEHFFQADEQTRDELERELKSVLALVDLGKVDQVRERLPRLAALVGDCNGADVLRSLMKALYPMAKLNEIKATEELMVEEESDISLAQSATTPVGLLSEFATHESAYVRLTVANNPALPKSSLKKLLKDPNTYVYNAARREQGGYEGWEPSPFAVTDLDHCHPRTLRERDLEHSQVMKELMKVYESHFK